MVVMVTLSDLQVSTRISFEDCKYVCRRTDHTARPYPSNKPGSRVQHLKMTTIAGSSPDQESIVKTLIVTYTM